MSEQYADFNGSVLLPFGACNGSGSGMSVGPRLALVDLPWTLVDTTRHPMNVAGLIICQQPEDATSDFVDTLVRDLRETTTASDPFNRRLYRRGRASIWPRWETVEEVDLGYHLRRHTVPAPGGRRELNLLVSALHRTRMDLTRPLWEVHVIDGLDRGRFAVYAKFHHSLVDGVGAIRVLKAAFSTDADERDRPPVWAYARPQAKPPRPRPSRWQAAGVVPRALAAIVGYAVGGAQTKPYSAPASILNTSITAERSVSTVSFDIDRLTDLADAMRGSLNDAFLAVCASALRQYLLDHDALPRRPLTAAVPISVRTPDSREHGNAITFAFVSLASQAADSRDRTDQVMASMAEAKSRLAALPRHVVDGYTVLTMAPFIVAQLVGVGARTSPMFNVAISNIPGPREPLFFHRARVLEIFPVSILQSGQAVNITALSYDGQLHATVTACAARLPDIGRLAALCGDALHELESTYAVEAAGSQ